MLPAVRRTATAATRSLRLAPGGIPIAGAVSSCVFAGQAEFARDVQTDARSVAGTDIPGVPQAGLRAWLALPLTGVERVKGEADEGRLAVRAARKMQVKRGLSCLVLVDLQLGAFTHTRPLYMGDEVLLKGRHQYAGRSAHIIWQPGRRS